MLNCALVPFGYASIPCHALLIHYFPPVPLFSTPPFVFSLVRLTRLFRQLTRHMHSCHLTFRDLRVNHCKRVYDFTIIKLVFSPSINFRLLVGSEVSEDAKCKSNNILGSCF